MEAQNKFIFFLAFILALISLVNFHRVDGAGECGSGTTPDIEAWKLAPCAAAAKDDKSEVSANCCKVVKQIGHNPPCLCAIMLSGTAKMVRVNPAIALTIPKRCNLADRPIGYKCGAYTLP